MYLLFVDFIVSNVFIYRIYSLCQIFTDILEMLALFIWDISLKLWREFSSTSDFWCRFLIADGCPLPTWCSRLISPLQKSARYGPMDHSVHALLNLMSVWLTLGRSLNSKRISSFVRFNIRIIQYCNINSERHWDKISREHFNNEQYIFVLL